MKINIIASIAVLCALNGCTKTVTVPVQSEENIEDFDRKELVIAKESSQTNIEVLRSKAQMIFSQEFESLEETSFSTDKPASESRFDNIVSDFKKQKTKSTQG